jgi:hypothetical protein
MKIKAIHKHRRSRHSGGLPLNLFQLSLLSTLLFNLATVLWGTAARASEPALTKSARSAQSAELLPVVPLDQPILESTSTAALPTAAEVLLAKNPLVNPAQAVQEPTAAPTLTVAAGETPIDQTISKRASDLEGAGTVQNIPQGAIAQTEPSPPAGNSSEVKPINNPLLPAPGWRFDFEPYLFVPLTIQGKIFFGRGRNLLFPDSPGLTVPTSPFNVKVNASLSDITSNLTNIFGVSGRVQAWNGNLGIVAEGLYINSGFRNSSDGGVLTVKDQFNIPIPGFQIDTQNTLSIFSLGASYRLGPEPLRKITDPSNPRNYYPAISFEFLAGFRYLSVFQSVKFDRGSRFEFSGSEVNPMLGGTFKLLLSKPLTLFFRADTSNLGGGNLKQYYNLYAGVDWKFSGSFALRLAYRFNQIEFVKRGRFEGDSGLNLRSQGVQLGLSWQF